MKASLKFWTVLLCAGLFLGSCCDDPISPEIPGNEDENPPVEQPEDPDEKPDDEDTDKPIEEPLTDGSLFTVQLNEDIMATVGTGTWNAIAYGNGKYVAVGTGGQIAYSTNGTDWTTKLVGGTSFTGKTSNWTSVCYGNGKFVVIGTKENSSYNDDSYIAYSTDGINWTTKMVWGYSEYKGVTWDSLYYGNGKFVAIGTDYYSNPNTLITYSTDGINWTTKEIWSNDDYTYLYWRSLCYGNGKFVAVGSSGHITYSTDGINWSMSQVDTSESGSGKSLTSVCYGNGKFYSFFEYSSGMRIAVSSNGVDWEVQNSKIDVPVSDILYVEYYNGIYVGLISPSFLSYSVIASFDGISWEVVHSSDKRLYCMKIAQ